MHHTLGEGDGDLLDTDRFFQILKPHRQVKAIFYGHSHVYEYGFREGKHLINLPAVGYNFSDAQPVGWLDARFHRRGGSDAPCNRWQQGRRWQNHFPEVGVKPSHLVRSDTAHWRTCERWISTTLPSCV